MTAREGLEDITEGAYKFYIDKGDMKIFRCAGNGVPIFS